MKVLACYLTAAVGSMLFSSFISADDNFTWSNTGAPVFGSAAAQTEGEKTRGEAEEEGSDEETPHSDEIHFEPIVSLPEVSVCCGAVSCAARVSGEV